MTRLFLIVLTAMTSLTACDQEAGDFDGVEAIAAAKVEVCHFNQGKGEYTLVDVSQTAVSSHLNHGDTLFADDPDCSGISAGLSTILSQCAEDLGLSGYGELRDYYTSSIGGTGSIEELSCFCDCGLCPDCGTFNNGCECAVLE